MIKITEHLYLGVFETLLLFGNATPTSQKMKVRGAFLQEILWYGRVCKKFLASFLEGVDLKKRKRKESNFHRSTMSSATRGTKPCTPVQTVTTLDLTAQ